MDFSYLKFPVSLKIRFTLTVHFHIIAQSSSSASRWGDRELYVLRILYLSKMHLSLRGLNFENLTIKLTPLLEPKCALAFEPFLYIELYWPDSQTVRGP